LLATYRSILREPGAARLVITAFLARLPVGMNALAIVLLVRRATGSFVDAGIADAGLALGSVLLSAVQGRLVDRFGQPKVLIPSALISSAALLALDVGVHRHLSIAVLTVFTAICGALLPPVSGSMRALWASLIKEPRRREMAFALEAVLTELYFVLGPLLTAAIIALADPSAAVITSACLLVVGTIAFATSRPSRRWRAASAKRTLAGPLAGPGMRTLVLSVVPMGLAFGTFEVTMPALATRRGDPAAAGILLGALAAGSLLGGLLYGSRAWRGSLVQRYLVLMAMFAAGMAPLIIAGAIPVMIVLMAVAGLTLAPVAACAFAIIEEVAPPGTTTEAFSWLFTANMAGSAAGAALAGTVIHSSGLRAALLIPLVGVGVSFLLLLAMRRTLVPISVVGVAENDARVSAGRTESLVEASGLGASGLGARGGTRGGEAPGSGRSGNGIGLGGVPVRVRRPRILAAGFILAAALLGYRARDGRSDTHRRPRRR
jgi:MFS family permease